MLFRKKYEPPAELLNAVQNYFIVWANKDKSPEWCKRTESAKAEVQRVLRLYGREI